MRAFGGGAWWGVGWVDGLWLVGRGLYLKVSASFVWTDLGVGRVMGSVGWGLSGLKQDGLRFVIWAVVLPDVLGQTVFAWGWGLAGLAFWAGQWPGWAVLFRLGLVFLRMGYFFPAGCSLLICLPRRAVPLWTY